jgi:hypothetical protein
MKKKGQKERLGLHQVFILKEGRLRELLHENVSASTRPLVKNNP